MENKKIVKYISPEEMKEYLKNYGYFLEQINIEELVFLFEKCDLNNHYFQ